MASTIPGLNVTRYQSDLSNPDNATAETVRLMCEQIRKSVEDPVLKRAARDAVERFKGGPLYATTCANPFQDAGAVASSVWWWAKHALRFQHHDGLIQVWFNERDQLQLLISPDLLLRMSKPRGDCAIYTMLECAMLKALGVPFEIVTAAVDPYQPDVFSHVYPRAILSSGRRLTLDASHGKYPGWEVPPEHTMRKQIWDENGNPVEDQARFSGLHAYQAYPNKPILPKRLAVMPGVRLGMGRYRGLGQDESTTTLSPGIDTSSVPLTNPAGGYPVVDSSGVTPSPFTSALAQSLPGLLAAWTNIGGKVLAPSVTYTGPGGVSYSAPASSAAAGALPLSVGTLQSTSFLPILLLGGVGLVLVLAFMGKK